MMADEVWTYREALKIARLLAIEGPRVAAIAYSHSKKQYRPLEGFADSNAGLPKDWKQIALVTPDGRVWKTRRNRPAAMIQSLFSES
jgi:hypothetical protein